MNDKKDNITSIVEILEDNNHMYDEGIRMIVNLEQLVNRMLEVEQPEFVSYLLDETSKRIKAQLDKNRKIA